MTAEQALEIITNAIQTEHETIEQDRALAIAQNALKKQIPQKPLYTKENIRLAMCYECPSCHKNFSGTGIADYCYHCGQKLDWSEEV